MEALDELTLRKRRARLLNPQTAPEEVLFGQMFQYSPPPPMSVAPMFNFSEQPSATPVKTEDPGPSMATESELPFASPQPTSETQSPSLKSREERLSGRLERRGMLAGRIAPIIMQGMSPSNVVSGIRDSIYRRARVEPEE